MNSKFDKLYNYLIETPDTIYLKNKTINYQDSNANTVSFFITKDKMVLYGEAPGIVSHGTIYEYIEHYSNLYDPKQKDNTEFWMNLEAEGVFVIDPTPSVLSVYENMGTYGRVFRIKNTPVISFWKDSPNIYPYMEAITKLLSDFGLNPKNVLWDVFSDPPIGHPISYQEFLKLSTKESDEMTRKRIQAEIALHTQAGLKRALGKGVPGRTIPLNVRYQYEKGRGG